jgi:uncharacterized protein HemY
MNVVVVVVTVVLVVSVLIATVLFLRSVTTSRRSLSSFRRVREDRGAEGFDAAAIRMNRDDWAGTSTDLPG